MPDIGAALRRILVFAAFVSLPSLPAACGRAAPSLAGGAAVPAVAAPPRAPLIVVSLDAFRWDYLERGITPNLTRLAESGVRLRTLVPAFPSRSFPNHWTLVTGLEPEHHGMVDNNFLDLVMGDAFHSGDAVAARDARWWGGEPLWATAEREGVRAATMFWPGSEAPVGGRLATYWRRYDARVTADARVDQVLAWLDLPAGRRPSLIALYLSDADAAGHPYGPDASQTADAIRRLDAAIGRLVVGLRVRGLEGRANLVVVSDHGMAAINTGRVVVLDDYIDPGVVDPVTLGALIAIYPLPGFEDSTARALARLPHTAVYPRAATPERWHYRANPRIAAFVGVADEGWQVVERPALELHPRSYIGGSHGYDPDVPSMAGILIAAGPAFRQGIVLGAMRNIHVYDLLCRAAGLRPAPNDGSPDSVREFFREGR